MGRDAGEQATSAIVANRVAIVLQKLDHNIVYTSTITMQCPLRMQLSDAATPLLTRACRWRGQLKFVITWALYLSLLVIWSTRPARNQI